ncbi:uncharacterized protein TNCV_3312861 [Trichonephila clavipes]|nr:uncharacterized protein TNCV_3312861 [Trichonephila clavipes]
MASTVLADPTRALQGTNCRSGPAMEESQNDIGSLEQLFLYADQHYLARKLPLGDHVRKVLHGVKAYHQRNVGPLRFHASQLKWTGYHRLWTPEHYTSWSARKGRLDLRFTSERCLEIVCGAIATPTTARIVERVNVGSTSACRTTVPSSLLVVFLVTPDPFFRTQVFSHFHCFQQILMVNFERSTWPVTRRVDQSAVFIPMIMPLSNSLNCEKYFLARLPGMFRLQKYIHLVRPT